MANGKTTRKAVCSARARAACLALTLPIVVPAQAELVWRSAPEVAVHEEGGGGHEHGGRRTGVYLRDGAGAVLGFWMPTLEQSVLAPAKPDGQVAVRPSGMDNYHLLLATRTGAASEETALRYMYMRGRPSEHSPTRLLAATKTALEIVPDPLPREHWRYQTSAPAVFRVRFQGKPLAGQPVRLVTTHGTWLEAMTDEKGRIEFTLPEDFAHVAPGRQANAPAEFILSVAHVSDGKKHYTTLSADYHANPSHWQSSFGGVLALLVGFAGGIGLWRRLPTEDQSA